MLDLAYPSSPLLRKRDSAAGRPAKKAPRTGERGLPSIDRIGARRTYGSMPGRNHPSLRCVELDPDGPGGLLELEVSQIGGGRRLHAKTTDHRRTT